MNWRAARDRLTEATQAVFGQKFYCKGSCFIGSFNDEYIESVGLVENSALSIDNVKAADVERIDFRRDDLIESQAEGQLRFIRIEKHPRTAGLYRIIVGR